MDQDLIVYTVDSKGSIIVVAVQELLECKTTYLAGWRIYILYKHDVQNVLTRLKIDNFPLPSLETWGNGCSKNDCRVTKLGDVSQNKELPPSCHGSKQNYSSLYFQSWAVKGWGPFTIFIQIIQGVLVTLRIASVETDKL